jgi:penicillin G amidase
MRILARSRRGFRATAMAAALLVSAGLVAPIGAAGAEQGEIRIVRDRFGVPHVFADSSEDAAYGVGYALAEDRLWQMHVFRLIGKGRLSELLGPIVVDVDKTIRFFTYTEEERARRFETYPEEIRQGLQAFVDGINAHIDEVTLNPSKLPFEFVQYGVGVPPRWTIDDSMGLQDVLILAFGSGGGNELAFARLRNDLVEQHGEEAGSAMFDDLILTDDPDSPVTIPRGFDYRNEPTFARDEEAESKRALEQDARLSLDPAEEMTRAGSEPEATTPAKGTLEQLSLIPDFDPALEGFEVIERGREMLERVFSFGSNAQIVGPEMTTTGNTAQTGGPQVGYLIPQWLADFGVHAEDVSVTGMTFAGAGPAVLIGRGDGYSWTTTTGASDLTDTYVEQLDPENPRRYEFDGSFEAMDCRNETYTFRGVPFENEEICRTRHGPVFAFDEDNGVAYSLRYAWFNREVQTIEGFFGYNTSKSVEDFATFSNYLSSNHNMFYTDDLGNYGYWHGGNHPVRADGIDLRLPQDGRGGSEWQGLLPVQEVPHAVNFERGWLTNWNNSPAEGWERERGYMAIDNATSIERALDPAFDDLTDPFGGPLNPDGEVDFDRLTANLRYGAFKHHADNYFRHHLPGDDALQTDLARNAAQVVRDWDGFLMDRDEDGRYDSAGNTIMNRWVATMRDTTFRAPLGGNFSFATDSLVWHLLEPDNRLELRHDWLGPRTPEQLAADAFEQAVAELADRFGNQEPETWREQAQIQRYQRLNADLFADIVRDAAGFDHRRDSGMPGDIPEHIRMDRGTYNHVVLYTTPLSDAAVQGCPAGRRSGPPEEPGRPERPGPRDERGRPDCPDTGQRLGHSEVDSGSVIPPGQSGFIDLAGRESPHYEDQLDLYVDWGFKPMPLTLEEALADATGDETISRP